jgi:hypothetical protein
MILTLNTADIISASDIMVCAYGNFFGIKATVEYNSYNKNQQDALFLKFIFVKNSTFFRQIYYPSSGVFTAIGICRTSYVDCLLARSGVPFRPR